MTDQIIDQVDEFEFAADELSDESLDTIDERLMPTMITMCCR